MSKFSQAFCLLDGFHGQRALKEEGDDADFTLEVGGAATRAIHAFGEGNYRPAAELLGSIRNRASRFGRSRAQRDLLDLTLISAASRMATRRWLLRYGPSGRRAICGPDLTHCVNAGTRQGSVKTGQAKVAWSSGP